MVSKNDYILCKNLQCTHTENIHRLSEENSECKAYKCECKAFVA